MGIYTSQKGREAILSLYDKHLERLGREYNDIYVDTSFGKTHIVETGNTDGGPLLVFHGGNSTTAYTLLTMDFLMGFHIYAADIIGHPGKSAEVSLSPYNYDYGKWVSEVIDALGYKSISCFGGSFGAGVIVKTLCTAPQKIKRAAVLIPSGISNAPAINSISMLVPMIMYQITHRDKWLIKTFMPLAINEDNITDDILEMSKLSIKYTKVKTGMPSDADADKLAQYTNPLLVMAADRVLPRIRKILPLCKTYLIKNRGHMHFLTDEEKLMITTFLEG